MRTLGKRLWDTLIAPGCELCGGTPSPSVPGLCDACRAELPFLGAACPQCAVPLPTAELEVRVRCPACAAQPPPFDAARAAMRYEGDAASLVRRYKFGARLDLTQTLAALMLRSGPPGTGAGSALVPVPAAAASVRTRGFNQAAELCDVLGHALAVPTLPRTARRRPGGVPQSSLTSRAARTANVSGCFTLARPVPTHAIVVDDVMTSAATAAELSRTLRAGGAERVDVWVFARAAFSA